jgi:hypothetical protein
MSVTLVADILLIVVAVAWILFKQVQAAPVKTRLLVIAPVLLGYFGITSTAQKTWDNSGVLLLILVGVAISVALGVPRGATIRVWKAEDGVWWRQGSKATLALWGALFLARGGLYVVAQGSGHQAASGVGPLLFALAVSFAAQNVVIGVKMQQGSRSDAPASFSSGQTPPSRPGSSFPSTSYSGSREPAYADAHLAGSLHERAEQRRAERRARRAARRQGWS